MPARRRSIIALLPVVTLLGACGSATTAEPGSPGPDDTTTTVAATGGWVGGEPSWNAGSTGEATMAAPAGRATSGSGSDDAFAEPAATESAAPVAPGPAAEVVVADVAYPTPDDVLPAPLPPERQGPLKAGSVDDNAEYEDYLAYLERLGNVGVRTRPFDPTGRIVVTVTGTNGLPVPGAEVIVSRDGVEVARLRTTADGTARFVPAMYGADTTATYTVASGESSAQVAAGQAASLAPATAGGRTGTVPIDILFLLDATGSMGDEIDRLKTTIDSIATRLESLGQGVDIHLAMTLYRDAGDSFVTATYDFTGSVDDFRTELAKVTADGGGDYPEALDEGLAEAIAKPAWRDPATTLQFVFLVADAPPQVDRQVPTPYTESIKAAVGRGLKVFPVASSESDDQAEAVFRQIAQATGARFVFLSYGAAGAATGPSTDIATTDYEQLALDDLIVRLVSDDLTHLTGQPASGTAAPTTSAVPPTNPEGQ